MSTAAPPPTRLITAEEYPQFAPDDRPSELVRGRIVVMTPPKTAHGFWCGRVAAYLTSFVEAHDLGRVTSNDAGILTERDPDTVRGADVAYYSFDRVPRGKPPEGYWPAPELVCEVKSPDDRWPMILKKIGEYLDVGVSVVWVVVPPDEEVHVYRAERAEEVFRAADMLTCQDVLPGFALPVAKIFE